MGWKWGCQPFSCRCSQNVTHCRKEICSTSLFKESIPTISFGNSKPPLPTRSLRSVRAAAHSTSSALWLHHAHPCVAAAEKSTCPIQRSRGFGHGVMASKICCYNAVIVLSGQNGWGEDKGVLAHEALQSSYRVEVLLPAFQLPMFAKCEALPKGDSFDIFV